MGSMVALSRIIVPGNIRRFPSVEIENLATAPLSEFPQDFQDGIEALARDIERNGLINPITVKDLGGGAKYRLMAGFRRYKAVQSLNKRMIDVKSVKGKTENELLVQLSENIQREDLNHLDIGLALKQIMNVKKITRQSVLAEYVNKSAGWVSQHLALLEASPALMDAVRTGEMGLAAARSLTPLSEGEQTRAVAIARSQANQEGGGKTSKRSVRRKARGRKSSKGGKQEAIQTVAQREEEQRSQLVAEFVGDKFGNKEIPEGVVELVSDFWEFLFRKSRIHIER